MGGSGSSATPQGSSSRPFASVRSSARSRSCGVSRSKAIIRPSPRALPSLPPELALERHEPAPAAARRPRACSRASASSLMISRKRAPRTMSVRPPPQVELMREETLKTFLGLLVDARADHAAADLHLLAERDRVGPEPEVLVRPHLARDADARLHLVEDEEARRARAPSARAPAGTRGGSGRRRPRPGSARSGSRRCRPGCPRRPARSASSARCSAATVSRSPSGVTGKRSQGSRSAATETSGRSRSCAGRCW